VVVNLNLTFEDKLLLLKTLPKESKQRILWQIEYLLSRTQIRYAKEGDMIALDYGQELGIRVYDGKKLREKLLKIEEVLKND